MACSDCQQTALKILALDGFIPRVLLLPVCRHQALYENTIGTVYSNDPSWRLPATKVELVRKDGAREEILFKEERKQIVFLHAVTLNPGDRIETTYRGTE